MFSSSDGYSSNMKRINSSLSSDDLILEDLETEGERQLRSLLHHQLDTSVSVEECVSKKQCFAPAAVYKPFGEEAAGVLSLSQFQALQKSDQEIASLRDLGLTDREIMLWKNRASSERGTGLGATPEATQDCLRDIEEKISEHQRILALPQRFAGCKQLSRREMEIEKALFQGNDRHSFLRALYYQGESHKRLETEKDPINNLETVYQEMMAKPHLEEAQLMRGEPFACPLLDPCALTDSSITAKNLSVLEDQGNQAAQAKGPSLCVVKAIESEAQQCLTGPKKFTEVVEFIPEEEIARNRLSQEDIRKIPMFASYSPGEPNKVLYLKNLSPRVTEKELVSLFARFQEDKGTPIQFRVLTGRMKGQAFITFPSTEIAQQALLLVNGYNLLGKTLVIEFGKNKTQRAGLHSAPPTQHVTHSMTEQDGN
ncbi:RNA-binding protein 41-like isoform X1 [Gracilinanus agilis]|uniref:RNA-binding protein 41-like isoform X1 n=1 Tax=Gracilinanus agilis TaxID=191870 RepID=UPI001CFC911F|nr:RNA-binding protein 41-like isoform X1 [Gracilinanus agilis]XP_044521385.1 RNA-binding protein 41-like isoform X1 [Gracilinanus agilis]XP_044521394.1 RNA-binding protein 41-like isoform X1 [Gracilinanus agilis]